MRVAHQDQLSRCSRMHSEGREASALAGRVARSHRLRDTTCLSSTKSGKKTDVHLRSVVSVGPSRTRASYSNLVKTMRLIATAMSSPRPCAIATRLHHCWRCRFLWLIDASSRNLRRSAIKNVRGTCTLAIRFVRFQRTHVRLT